MAERANFGDDLDRWSGEEAQEEEDICIHIVQLLTLQPHGLKHSRLPCPSPTPRAYSNSFLSSWWYHPTISPSVLPFSSHHQDFSNESTLHIRWPKYWRFSFSVSPSSEYSGLISFKINWLDLLPVQETLKRVFPNTTIQKYQFFSA